MSGFASSNDLAEKVVSFDELGPGLYGWTAEGDPNSGIVVGDDSVLVVDAQATPKMAAGPSQRQSSEKRTGVCAEDGSATPTLAIRTDANRSPRRAKLGLGRKTCTDTDALLP